jgi:hypothetical protein
MAEAVSIICRWAQLNNSSDEFVRSRLKQLLLTIAEGLFDRNPMRKDPVNIPEWLRALNMLIQRNDSSGIPEVDYINIVVNQIQDRLKNSDYVEPEEIGRLLEALVELNFTEPIAGETLKSLVDGGQILHYFNYMHVGKSAHASCAWCILTLSYFAENLEPSPPVGNSAHGYAAFVEMLKKRDGQDIHEFAKLLVRYKDNLTYSILKRDGLLDDFFFDCLKHISIGPAAESFSRPSSFSRTGLS